MRKIELTKKRLQEVLDYNPETGIFTWKVNNSSRARAGARAGGGSPSGHRSIMIDRESVLAQRLAWFWTYGEWPRSVRFKDGNPENCAISNLYQTLPREGALQHYNLKRNFGISLSQYKEMLSTQNGCCAICEQAERGMRGGKLKAMPVDHDHITNEVRGLLCSNCNLILGHAGDSEEILLKAIAYLRRHKKTDTVVPLHLVKDEAS